MRVYDENFLRYYWEELTYLRKMGTLFARRYPKVGARLELEADVCPDPHVERLIESFAFLTARIQHSLDSDFPEIASELLDILYPNFIHPIPSMSIARFVVDPDRGKLTTGYRVDRQTPLFTHSERGRICRFWTCYPVELFPVEVTEGEFQAPDQYSFLDRASDVATVLRLRVESQAEPLAELEMDRLRFYLHGDRLLVSSLFELIFNHTLRVAIVPDDGPVRLLPAEAVQPVGFGVDEGMLPSPGHAHPAYRLLQEYFLFPEKFSFFEVTGLDLSSCGAGCEILLLLDQVPKSRLAVSPETFALGCTPIVNLFRRTSEPIRVDHRQLYYRLIPDQRRYSTTEIYSIVSVAGSRDPDDKSRAFQPFYSYSHELEQQRHTTFWHAKRVPMPAPDADGTEVQLSFLDVDFKPALPPAETVYAHLLCTNRRLAEQVPAGGLLQTDEGIPVQAVVCLNRPTAQLTPPLSGETLWRLVSHLSLNYLSLAEGADSLKALKELLRLYSVSETAPIHQQINGLREMSQRKVVRRLGEQAWMGFCRGTEVTISFDENNYVGSSAFLFGMVLNRFFALFSSTNSFTQLVVKSQQREGVWKRWPPMAGEKAVL